MLPPAGDREVDEAAWERGKAAHRALADEAAPCYDADYARTAYATACVMRFEEVALARVVAATLRPRLALDLGCGTGRLARVLGTRFQQVWGCDFSGAMVAAARTALPDPVRYDFVEQDVEGGLPQADASVDLVNAGFGLFSFVRDPAWFLSEAARVLAPGGALVLSAYNADALSVPPDTPWQPALRARFAGGQLAVQHGGRAHAINGTARSLREIEAQSAPWFEVERAASLPLLAGLVPAAALERPEVQALAAAVDAAVAFRRDLALGPYLWVVLRRR